MDIQELLPFASPALKAQIERIREQWITEDDCVGKTLQRVVNEYFSESLALFFSDGTWTAFQKGGYQSGLENDKPSELEVLKKLKLFSTTELSEIQEIEKKIEVEQNKKLIENEITHLRNLGFKVELPKGIL